MKHAGPLLALLVAVSPAILPAADELATTPAPAAAAAPAAATPTTAAPAKVSSQVSGLVTAGLPKYNPVPPAPIEEVKPANAPNPDVLELPKMRVKPRDRPRLAPAIVITAKGESEKNMTALDRSLNSITLPFFGQSYADRMRDEKERSKNEQMRNEALALAKTAEVTDPAQAQAIRDAVNHP